MRNLGDYLIWGEHDRAKLKQAHDLIIEFSDAMYSGKDAHDIQDLLLNGGHLMDDDRRPGSAFDLGGSYPRSRVKAGLAYLQNMMRLATDPGIIIVRKPLIHTDGISGLIVPSEIPDYISFKTASGMDPSHIEYMQREWLTRENISSDARELEKLLQSALDEFNLQGMLSLMQHASQHFIYSDWKDIIKQQKKLQKISWKDVYTPLDNAYYTKAKEFIGHTGVLVERLMADDYGNLFIITPEDIKNMIAAERKSHYDM